MNELKTRAIFGAIYVATVLAGVWFHSYGLLALLILVFVIGLNEMKHLYVQLENQSLYISATILGVFVLWAHRLFTIDGQNHLMLFSVMMFMILFVQHLFTKGSENNLERLPKLIFSLLYLFIPTSLAISLTFLNGNWEPRFLLAVFIVLWTNDTFAYLSGMKFGKHKLIPRLSPNKSIEGLIGGFIGALLIGFLLSHFWNILSLPEWLIFSAIVSITGNIGDLFESSLKRSAGIKDSGNLIPGHGGVLDRLDSFLFAVPFVYFYLFFFT